MLTCNFDYMYCFAQFDGAAGERLCHACSVFASNQVKADRLFKVTHCPDIRGAALYHSFLFKLHVYIALLFLRCAKISFIMTKLLFRNGREEMKDFEPL